MSSRESTVLLTNLHANLEYPMADPPLRIIPGSSYTHLEHNTTRPNSEGAYQFRWVEQATGKNWYYLFFSSGACCNDPDKLEVPGEEYRIEVVRQPMRFPVQAKC
jgi:arabinan endo-1,5-alpha-L-arabinosidase